MVDVLFTRRRRRKQRKIKVGALWGSEVGFDVGFGEGISGIMREVDNLFLLLSSYGGLDNGVDLVKGTEGVLKGERDCVFLFLFAE